MILSTYKIKDMEVIKVEKERKVKALSLVALIIAVLGLTLAFAALSQTLTINGTASVNAAEWDIHFENLSEPTITGSAIVNNVPTFTGTEITDFDVSLTKPGDSVTYEFDIVNNGTIDAKLDELVMNTFFAEYAEKNIFTCIGKTTPECLKHDYNKDGNITSADFGSFVGSFNFHIFEDGEKIKEYSYNNRTGKESGFQIAGKTTKHVSLVIGFKEDAEFVLDEPVKIFDSSKPAIQLNFVQK